MKNYLKIVQIDNDSMKPKYLQLVDAIANGVQTEVLVDGDNLPSIHDFCVALEVSKTTIQKAYTILKNRGIIGCYHGKGHFIFHQRPRQQA
jgi:DNA-binding transcriptional regulator YhcF (GntR family)